MQEISAKFEIKKYLNLLKSRLPIDSISGLEGICLLSMLTIPCLNPAGGEVFFYFFLSITYRWPFLSFM